jgi:hypothetical protein
MHAIAFATLLLRPAGAAAQATTESGDLVDLLPELLLKDVTLPTPTTPGLSHAVHFSPIDSQELDNPVVAIIANFNKLTALQFSTFPLGSSTGGFTYAFDESLGTFRRSTSSFGPSFAERALTIGRRRLSAGLNYQHTRYDTFEGEDLRDGSIKFYLRHQECCSPGGPPVPPFFGVVETPNGTRLSPFFEGDVIEAALSLDATVDSVVFFANYGLTDRWDAGIAVPVLSIDLEANVLATILRLATSSNPQIHSFELGNPDATQRTFTSSGSATGLGDIVLRSKYNFVRSGATGISAAIDLRVPTGDQANLLGAGGTQTKVFGIISTGSDRFAQHVNVGYTFVNGDISGLGALLSSANASLPDEINYTGGVEFVATPRLTLIADVVGRTLRDAGRLSMIDKRFEFEPPVPEMPPPSVTLQEFDSRSGNLNLLLGTVGAKFNPTGNLLVSGNVLFPLTDAGLRSRYTIVVGMDYAF